MAVTTDITDQAIFTALRSYLLTIVPAGVEVVQSQDNLVPSPLTEEGGKIGFCALNNTSMVRLATNVTAYNPFIGSGEKAVLTAFRYSMQIDFYGSQAALWAAQASSLFRDEYATDIFPSNIQPLYADDPIQTPLIDGEDQWEQRWRVQASIQYNPTTTVGQDFATSLTATIIEVDAFSHPN